MVADSAIKSLENLCRTCMGERKTEVIPNNTRQEVKSLISIYHKHETKDSGNITIMELLKQTSPKLTLDADDMLPKHICENCLDVLVNVHEFQKKSLKVEQRLRNIVKEHYSSHEMDVDPLNINKVKHAEGDLKIEIDEPISDVTTPLRGFFTLIQKDGNIIEVYNDLEKSDLVVSDGNEKCETGDNIGGKRKPQFNTAASETRNNENDELLDIKFWKYIEEDYSIDIPVMKEHTSKEGKPVNGEVNNHLHKYDQDEKRVDKIMRKSNRDLGNISGNSNNRKQKRDDEDLNSEGRHQPTIPICNDMKEVAEEESLKSEVSDSTEISVEGKSEWEPTLDKSQSFMRKSIESDSKLEGNFELKNGDKKVNSVKLDNRGFPCNECGKPLKTSLGLKRHLQIQHSADNGHICPECGMRLKTRITFRRHLSRHEKDEAKIKYKCQYCNKIFYQTSALRCHVRTHTGERPYLCSVCGKSFPTIYSLNLHSQLHGTEFNYQCPECPKRFRCKSNMTTHKAIVHSTARPHVCDVCGASFKKPYGLTKHKINHGEKKHKCDYCELRFSHPNQCQRHMRTHTGEKPYKCKYCEISYSQSNEVMKHLRVHLGDNVYRCEMCPQAFRMLSELRVHFNSHKDDDEETKSQNLQALQEEEKRILTKIERAKATEQQS